MARLLAHFYQGRLMFFEPPFRIVRKRQRSVVVDATGRMVVSARCFGDAQFIVDACNAYMDRAQITYQAKQGHERRWHRRRGHVK